MNAKNENNVDLNYSVSQKWLNTKYGAEFYFRNIDDSIIALDDEKGKLSSFKHTSKILWNHLVKIGLYKRIL